LSFCLTFIGIRSSHSIFRLRLALFQIVVSVKEARALVVVLEEHIEPSNKRANKL